VPAVNIGLETERDEIGFGAGEDFTEPRVGTGKQLFKKTGVKCFLISEPGVSGRAPTVGLIANISDRAAIRV
jgi:hypothetical protein